MRHRFTVLIDVPHDFEKLPYEERQADHNAVLAAYFRTFEKRAFDEKTTKRTRKFLNDVFESILIKLPGHDPQRHLLMWDLLQYGTGEEIIDLYALSISKYEYAPTTQMKYMGEIRRLFDFILKRPFIPGRTPISITEKYGAPCQPVTHYDYPEHGIQDPDVDPALINDDLRKFLDFVRIPYIGAHRKKNVAERNYAIIVVAVTSGLRANELAHLDVSDLRWDDKRVWVRFGKGHQGSGKRHRVSIFTTFAQATLRVYLDRTRLRFELSSRTSPALFLTEQGNRITYGAMRNALETIIEQARDAGLEIPAPFGWHDSRRSFATGNLDKRPDSILQVSAYMGHTGLGTLHRYNRPRKHSLRAAAKRVMGRVMPPQ
jgi:integrase